ncbi:hypothetical protein [Bosea vaviloviae]|uniref:Uncharacterized protein n=1 Tax=Bosea vaviloviae TaxID=1526658 RepID=A0A0N1F610_9HYPH|nr:hypothetical protein [Bosea vaviloviae]KPH80534.1 hypothetical protein AE618_12200 [Bosea vaviloviae]
MLAAFALRNWRVIAGVVAVLVLLALAGLGFWQGMAAIDAMELRAAATARAERDALWRAEIATSNALVEKARADQALAAMAADAKLRDAAADFETKLKDLEGRNAELPHGDRVGIGRDRVRLLNGAR